MAENQTMCELIDEWQDENNCHNLEGDHGIDILNKLAEAIGYKGHQFLNGQPLEVMLADNPGLQTMIVEWIGEQEIPEWREELESHLPEKEDE